MRKIISIVFLFFSIAIFSQKKVVKKFQTAIKKIEISTEGLDDFVIENATSDFIEISLYAENSHKQLIFFEEKNNIATIQFNIKEFSTDETIFRKYITKRLNRASATIKIPKNIHVVIFGGTINIDSKSCKNNLQIFIENGTIKLHTVKDNTAISLYGGNVYATLKNTNIDAVSNTGNIKVDDVLVNQKHLQKNQNSTLDFKINSIKANIFLTTK